MPACNTGFMSIWVCFKYFKFIHKMRLFDPPTQCLGRCNIQFFCSILIQRHVYFVSDNVVIKFIVEKEDTSSKDGNAKKTVIMKGPLVADELNNKLKVGQDILKV